MPSVRAARTRPSGSAGSAAVAARATSNASHGRPAFSSEVDRLNHASRM